MYQSHTGTSYAPTPAAIELPAVQAKSAVDAATESTVQSAAHDEPPTYVFHADRMRELKKLQFF